MRLPVLSNSAPLKAISVPQRLPGAFLDEDCSSFSAAAAPALGGKQSVPTQQLLISFTCKKVLAPAEISTGCCLINCLKLLQLEEKFCLARIANDSSTADTP